MGRRVYANISGDSYFEASSGFFNDPSPCVFSIRILCIKNSDPSFRTQKWSTREYSEVSVRDWRISNFRSSSGFLRFRRRKSIAMSGIKGRMFLVFSYSVRIIFTPLEERNAENPSRMNRSAAVTRCKSADSAFFSDLVRSSERSFFVMYSMAQERPFGP